RGGTGARGVGCPPVHTDQGRSGLTGHGPADGGGVRGCRRRAVAGGPARVREGASVAGWGTGARGRGDRGRRTGRVPRPSGRGRDATVAAHGGGAVDRRVGVGAAGRRRRWWAPTGVGAVLPFRHGGAGGAARLPVRGRLSAPGVGGYGDGRTH